MTTKVTIDAHAGWPVDVTMIQKTTAGEQRTTKRVAPNTVDTVYVHSGCDLFIHEVQPAAEPKEPAAPRAVDQPTAA